MRMKWLLGIAISVLALTLLSALFFDRELTRMYGGLTRVAAVNVQDRRPATYALVNVNVLTPAADGFGHNRAVVIENERIASVGEEGALPPGIPKINGNGMYLVPGFIDSHVHLWQSENDLLLYIANGVTQIREMNGSSEHLRWKREVEAGRIGPDMFVASPQLATFDPIEGWLVGWTQRKRIVRSQDDVEQAVRAFKSAGYDAVKSSSFLSPANYASLSRATKRLSIPLVGHIPQDADLDALWNSNQSELAHVEELLKALLREFGGYDSDNAEMFLRYVRSRSGELADRLLEKNIAVTSTLSLIDSFPTQKADLDGMLDEPDLDYANPGITEGTIITSRGMGWLPEVNIYRFPSEWSESRRQKSLSYWRTYAKAQHIVFEALLEKGVSIMAGTDANVPVMVPGFSLHQEMKTLNDAGMTPQQVLASATRIPASWAKTNDGQIRAGFNANLVLLRGNPLNDVSQTASIAMVIKDGRIFSREDLDQMLAAVKSANDASRTVDLPD